MQPTLIRRPIHLMLFAALAALLTACAAGPTSPATDGPVPPGAVARLGRGAINVMAADPSGGTLVVGTGVGLTVYEARSFEVRWQNASAVPVTAVALSADGAYLAAGLESGLVLILDAANGELINNANGPAEVSALGWSTAADGSPELAMGFANGVLLFISGQITGGELVMDDNPAPPVRDISGISTIAYSPAGDAVAAGNRSGTVNLWNPADQSLIGSLTGHETGSQVLGLAWTPDGEMLVSGASDDTAILWDVASQTASQTLGGHDDAVLSVAASADRVLTVDAAGQVITWGLGGARIGQAGPLVDEAEAALAAPAADAVFLFAHADGALGRWQIGSQGSASRGVTFTGHWPAADHSQAVAWSPDGQWIASGAGSKVLLWDAETLALHRTLDAHTMRVDALAFSPDGATLASGSSDRSISLWRVPAGEQIATLTGHRDAVAALSWSPDGSRLASAGSLGDRVLIWDIESGDALASLPGDGSGGVFSVAWSPDGSTLAAGLNSGSVLLWDVSGTPIDEDPIQRIEGHIAWVGALARSPDSQLLASGSADTTIAVYDREDGSRRVYTGHQYVIRGLAFDADGSRLASAAQDRQVMVWDVRAGGPTDPLFTLTGHTAGANAVAWSPGGGRLASASDDGTVVLWLVGSGE